MERTRVFLADDHAITRYGLRTLLELADCAVVGEAADGPETLRLCLQYQPDVVIMDISMPGLNGIETTRAVRARLPATQVVMLSMHSSSEHVHRAQAAGALGYLLKEEASEQIVAAVRAARVGKRYLGSALADLAHLDGTRTSPIDSLSMRERQVLQMVVEGHSSASIAALIHLSPKSVDTYRHRLMSKLGVADVTALVKFALEHALSGGS